MGDLTINLTLGYFYCPPGPPLHSQPQNITLTVQYQIMLVECMNNLPRAVTSQNDDLKANSRPLDECVSFALTTTLPSQSSLHNHALRLKKSLLLTVRMISFGIIAAKRFHHPGSMHH